MAPALAFDALDLAPQNLIKRHYADAAEEWTKIQVLKAKNTAANIKHTGPQGSIEPFTIVDDPSAWHAADIKQDDSKWLYKLTEGDVKEIDAALRVATSLGVRRTGNLLHLQEAVSSREHFPLPTLGPKLEAMREEVRAGRGFQLIRGLPVERYSREEVVTLYWGFGLYWGNVVSQNQKAHIVGHVKNIGFDVNRPTTRVYGTPLAQPWHNDSADIVGLLCLKTAKEGGLSSWASSVSIHNEMLKVGRKDLVEELAKPQWWIDRKGEIPEGKKEYYQLQVFNYHQGYLSISFADTYYQLAQRHPEVPRLTEKQKEALRVFTAYAQSDDLRMDFSLQPGDIQLLCNHTQQHTRQAFVDHEDIADRRHLLRLWVAPPNDRPLPERYAELWGKDLTPGKRGGIYVEGTPLTVPLEAE